MGGRRARSVGEVVGSVASSYKSNLTRALERQSPEDVAASSAQLVAHGKKAADIVYLASKLTDFVARNLSATSDLSYTEREKLAREAWSKLKASEGLADDPITTKALVSAVASALGTKDD